MGSLTTIVVDSRYQNNVNHDGETLIPPTLQEFARTFAADLGSSVGRTLDVSYGTSSTNGSIFLTLDNSTNFHDAAGRRTSEGYSLMVNTTGITIAGASPLGTWWGTRSVIQAALLNNGSVPFGSGVDAPGWGTRGVMLDAGRHYYPPEFLIEICAHLSFFKQNTFHLHLSDNQGDAHLNNLTSAMGLYSAFRLNSDAPELAGLVKRKNESYTKETFETIQQQCARRGVTIIPEIEAPGHALAITQWKPHIGLNSDYTMLNISHPDTIPTIKAIWDTFLPWFHSKTVHIGADEYDSKLRTDYNRFVNEINNHISKQSGKAIRIWGTFPPKNGSDNISQNVTIQHWAFFEDNPYHDYIKNGYNVLNSDDGFYIVNKWSRSYPQSLNKTRIFNGNPAGGPFSPHIFDTKNPQNNPPRDNARVLGHIAAQWNDLGPTATVYSEAYYNWRDNLPALADKQWGGDLLVNEYDAIFGRLHDAIPGQNLDRAILTKSRTILKYNLTQADATSGRVLDSSGNLYDGTNRGCAVFEGALVLNGSCYVDTPLKSKGRPYTLSFSAKPFVNEPGTLFAGTDSALAIVPGNNGSMHIALIASGNTYSLNYSLPAAVWTSVKLIARGNQTFFEVVGGSQYEFTTVVTLGGVTNRVRMAIEAPLSRIGEGFKGQMKDIELTDRS